MHGRTIIIKKVPARSSQSCGRPGVPRNCGQANPRSPQKHYTYRNKNLSAKGGYAQLLVQHGALGARFHKRYLHSSEKSFQARKGLSSTCTYLLPTGMACSLTWASFLQVYKVLSFHTRKATVSLPFWTCVQVGLDPTGAAVRIQRSFRRARGLTFNKEDDDTGLDPVTGAPGVLLTSFEGVKRIVGMLQ